MTTSTPVFTIELEGGTLVLTPQRNISSLAEDEVQQQWDDLITQVTHDDVKHVVFDFCNVSYFGSSMLEAMLSIWKKIALKEGSIAVCNLSGTGLEIMQLAKFDTIWQIAESRAAAMESFSS